MAQPVVAVVGATGAVGVEFLGLLDKREFPLSDLRLFATARSKGRRLSFKGEELVVEELTPASFKGVDIVLSSVEAPVSREFSPIAVGAGAVVVDNSSAFRMDLAVPLVVPEINGGEIALHRGIIANPNCVAIISDMAIWPIHRRNPIRRLIVSAYQAASGAGAPAMEELRESTRAYLEGRPFEPTVLPHPYAFNLFSHNTAIDPETGYNEEETKVGQETRKILGDPGMRISATCIRVPVLRAHAMALNFECEYPITPTEVRNLLGDAPGIRVVDDQARNYFPMPSDASGQDDILVGRIRQDTSDRTGKGMTMFACGDQLLKGAALNAVQIAEYLVG